MASLAHRSDFFNFFMRPYTPALAVVVILANTGARTQVRALASIHLNANSQPLPPAREETVSNHPSNILHPSQTQSNESGLPSSLRELATTLR